MKRSERGSWQANCEALRALGMSQFNLSRTEQQHFFLGFVVYGLSLVLCLRGLIFFFNAERKYPLCVILNSFIMNVINIRIIYLYHFVRGDEKFAYYFQTQGKIIRIL